MAGGGRLEGPEKTIDLGKSLGEGFIFYNIFIIYFHKKELRVVCFVGGVWPSSYLS